ncbi:MAG: NADH-quinone oxidoreductase subunit NuoH [Dehalococcoidia bacterium]|nr:NADH-quinone oxidoreductase subunit NuoH [Dehalococcoidia bacterium]
MTLLDQLIMWLDNYWPHWASYLTAAIIGVIVLVVFVVLGIIVVIYTERRLLGRFQVRLGPNRVGPEGIFQPFADAVKVLTKEDIVPKAADHLVHWLAPVISFIPVIMVFAVVPVASGAVFADLDVGILYLAAVSSLSVLGLFMAGWGSNNKYSLIAALRSVSQMVGYELPVVFTMLAVVVAAGSMSLSRIVEAQTSAPFFITQPLGFIIFFLATLAEINRSPFDLLEADSEIVAGVHTEYSGMKFAMFYLGEYGHAFGASCIITTLFLGGWQGPFLPGFLWFLIKGFVVFFLMIWVRATMPRVRVDQLTYISWKLFLPLAILNLIIVSMEQVFWPGIFPWVLTGINLLAGLVLVLLIGRAVTVRGGRVEV